MGLECEGLMRKRGKLGPWGPWVECDGLELYVAGTHGRFEDLDHLQCTGLGLQRLMGRWGTGKATPSSKSLAPSPQPTEQNLLFLPPNAGVTLTCLTASAHQITHSTNQP